jgi:hypothetical protein
MEFSTEEHCHIAAALADLARGDWRAFENRLWLAFGDRWEHVRTMLVQHRHVVLRGQWKDEPALTERGKVLLQRLGARPSTVAG